MFFFFFHFSIISPLGIFRIPFLFPGGDRGVKKNVEGYRVINGLLVRSAGGPRGHFGRQAERRFSSLLLISLPASGPAQAGKSPPGFQASRLPGSPARRPPWSGRW